MVGIGNLFPFEVTQLFDTQPTRRSPQARMASAKGADQNGSTPVSDVPHDNARSRICRKAGDYILGFPLQASLMTDSPQPPGAHRAVRPTHVVLDTNVVLDWLLFEDADARALGHAVAMGAATWIGTTSTLQELNEVLARRVFDRWQHRRTSVLAAADRFCQLRPAPVVGADLRLWCTDPEDQPFIDLALSAGARWLFSRDKAVLRLARRARAFGVEIAAPVHWTAGSP